MAVNGEEVTQTLAELGISDTVRIEICYNELLEKVGVRDESTFWILASISRQQAVRAASIQGELIETAWMKYASSYLTYRDSMAFDRAVAPVDCTSGSPDLREDLKALRTGFMASLASSSPSVVVVGASRVGWTISMSVIICRAIVCSAGWPFVKQWMKSVKFSSARFWILLAFLVRQDSF